MFKKILPTKLGVDEIVRAKRQAGASLTKIAVELKLSAYHVRRALGIDLPKGALEDEMLTDMQRLKPVRRTNQRVSHVSRCETIVAALNDPHASIEDLQKQRTLKRVGLASETIRNILNKAGLHTLQLRIKVANKFGSYKELIDDAGLISAELVVAQARSMLIGRVQCSLFIAEQAWVDASLYLVAHASSAYFWGTIELGKNGLGFAGTLVENIMPDLGAKNILATHILLPRAVGTSAGPGYIRTDEDGADCWMDEPPMTFDGLGELTSALEAAGCRLVVVHDGPVLANPTIRDGFNQIMSDMNMAGRRERGFADIGEARAALNLSLHRWNKSLLKADLL
jgi:hypothetical protein